MARIVARLGPVSQKTPIAPRIPPGIIPPPSPVLPPVVSDDGLLGATPILMYDSVSLTPGQEQPFKSTAFLNNRGRRVSIREMRVTVSMVTSTANAIAYVAPVNLVELQLNVKRKSGRSVPITRGYVPASAMCRSINRLAENFGLATTVTATGTGSMMWAFSSPLDLAPGDVIEAQAKNIGLTDLPVVVDLAFAGADTLGAPSMRVPYVVHWQSKDFAYATPSDDSAPPDKLVNDSGVELHVDRIIGRFLVRANRATGQDQVTDFYDATGQAQAYAYLRMSLSQSRQVLRDFTLFRAVFGQEASIETAFKLAPKDYMNVDVRHVASPAIGYAFNYFIGRAIVSLVGCREAM